MAMQIDLFATVIAEKAKSARGLGKIKGLALIENYLSVEEEIQLMRCIDKQPWLDDLQRRVQHYGYRYDYRRRRIELPTKVSALPDWALAMAARLEKMKILMEQPDQLIVNEYLPGRGIAAHMDAESCFSETIVSVSLGSTVQMDFTKGNDKVSVLLPRRSLIQMKGESRYQWKHGIVGRKSDRIGNTIYPRQRRISLTFRKVLISS